MKEIIRISLKVILFPKKFWTDIFHRNVKLSFVTKYMLSLALIGPILSVFSMSVIGDISFKKSLLYAVTTYLLDIASVYIFAFLVSVIDKNIRLKTAINIAVFGSTPIWLSDIVDIYQPLRPLSTIGLLYSLYIIYMAIKLKSPKGHKIVGLLLFIFILLYVLNAAIAESIVKNPLVKQIIV